VLIHFDLDVIGPAEMIAAVGTDPDGMTINGVTRVINDIASQFDIVGPPSLNMPIKIRNLLGSLPLLRS